MTFDPHQALYNGPIDIGTCAYYGASNTYIHCAFCGVGVESSSWISHLADRYHKENANSFRMRRDVEKDLSARRQTVTTILPQVSDLGLARWRDDLRSQLLTYSTDQGVVNLYHVKAALNKYDLKERVSLLELAVWKAMCLLSKQNSTACNALDWHLWSVLGWRTAKKDTRDSNAIAIVITHVTPYLSVEDHKMPLATNIW